MGWEITSEARAENVDQLTIIRRAAERGLRMAQELDDDAGASYYVRASDYIDLFQRILDELDRIKS